MDELEQAKIKQLVEFYRSVRVNFSPETDKIMKEIEKGKEPSELDVFLLINNDPIEIENYKKYYQLKEKAKNGKINRDDIIFLVNELRINDEELEKKLIDELAEKVETDKEIISR